MSPPGPWGGHALQWDRVGPPLRPSPQDVALFLSALDDWRAAAGRNAPTLLLMGVTPELCALPTGRASRVIAADRSIEMIRAVWPGRLRPGDRALCADWLRLPFRSDSVDLVLADGCLSTLSFPGGYAVACAGILRVLRHGGRCVARCFVLPERREETEDVFADLGAGRGGSFHAFKWRLAMALQPDPETGVVLDDVWRVAHAAEGDLESLARRGGWPLRSVRTIEAYRGVTDRYSFPARAELCDLFARAGFSVLECARPAYDLGDRCPTLVLTPLPAAQSQ